MLYQINNGAVELGAELILRKINFEIRDKEKIAIVGRNGCGKTTLLNLIGESLKLQRSAPFNRSSFYSGYLKLCHAETSSAFSPQVREASRVITSDDVFDYLLDFRSLNENIDLKRKELLSEYTEKRYSKLQMRSLEDLDELRKVVDAQRHTGSRYVNEQLMRDIPGKSNGESAFLYFTRHIQEGGLYLLDEPENSLSPKMQLALMDFISMMADEFNCQFIIASHSPFFIGMNYASVYNLDADIIDLCDWTELESIQVYRDFFRRLEHNLIRREK